MGRTGFFFGLGSLARIRYRERCMPPVILFVLAMTPFIHPSADVLSEIDARTRSAQVSNPEYDLELSFRRKSGTYTGRALLHFDLGSDNSDLRLDFRYGTLGSLRINGLETSFESTAAEETEGQTTTRIDSPADTGGPDRAQGNGVTLTLPASQLMGGSNNIEIRYENPYDRTSSGVHRFLDPEDDGEYIYTDFEPYLAHRLMPCFDQPDLKATFRVTVTAPANWEVISNSPAHHVETGPDDDRIWSFKPTPPLPTYLMFVGAGDYAAITDEGAAIPTRILARRPLLAHFDGAALFELTRRGFTFYEEYFGRPYPFEKYDQLFVPEFPGGAMENPGAVTFSEGYLFRQLPTTSERQERAETLLHEMAHMWFGNLVTMRWWDGLWLNESFATYMANVAMQNVTEFTSVDGDFLFQSKAWAYREDQLPTTHPVAGDVRDTDTAFSSFDGITYGKGGALLKQLAWFIGEDAFRTGLKKYFETFAWRNTEIADFFTALSQSSGTDLAAWAQSHLETKGVNTLQPRIVLRDSTVESLHLDQGKGNGDKEYRSQRIQVALYRKNEDGTLEQYALLPVTFGGPETPVPAAIGLKAPDLIWPNHGDLAYVRAILDEGSLDVALNHMGGLSHELTRRGLWITFWEMIREERLDPARFVDLFTKEAPRETTPIIEGMQGWIRQIIQDYIPDQGGASRQVLQDLARGQLERAPPGSDDQKIWFSFALLTAQDRSVPWLESILEGSVILDGLEMGVDRRWDVVTALCTMGAEGNLGRMDDLARLDGSHRGKRRLWRARASLGNSEVKQRFWDQFLSDRKTSVKQLSAAMEGFFRPGQQEITAPFVKEYFKVLPRLVRERDPLFTETFARELFPRHIYDAQLVTSGRRFLADHPDLPADVRKVLLEETDELARCLRIRARW